MPCRLHILLTQDTDYPALRDSIALVCSQFPDAAISIFAVLSPSEKGELAANSLKSVVFYPKNSLPAQYNEAIKNTTQRPYLLFLNSSVKFDLNIVPALLEHLERDHALAGVNPLLIDPQFNCVFQLGYVFDAAFRIYSLYRGLSPDLPFIKKTRRFQAADQALLLMRRDLYIEAGGHDPGALLPFAFLCLRLVQRGKYFTTACECRAFYANKKSWNEKAGLWNSFAMRGKFAPGLIRADYASHVLCDGLDYKITKWLHETAGQFEMPDDPWYQWQADPEPSTLLRYLAQSGDPEILAICRSYPCWLPMQFSWYGSLALRQCAFAQESGLPGFFAQVRQWLKKASIFHYKYLLPGIKALAAAGIYNFCLDQCPGQYDAWIELVERHHTRLAGSESIQLAVIMPVYNPHIPYLQAAVRSVLAQTHQNWRLYLIDDASSAPEVWPTLQTYEKEDPRIKAVRRAANGMISRATNTGIELAEAPWTAFMDQDDLLAANALAEIAGAIGANPDALIICTDEDCITEHGIRRSPNFRAMPDTYPRGHLFVYKSELLKESGGCDPAYDGAQDTELNLRLLRKIRKDQLAHVPQILYHWRIHEQSTSGSLAAKPYVRKAFALALANDASQRFTNHCEIPNLREPFRIFCKYTAQEPLAVILQGPHDPQPDLQSFLQAFSTQYQFQIYRFKSGSPNTAAPPEDLFAWAAHSVSESLLLFLSADLRPLPGCDLGQMLVGARDSTICAIGGMLWHGPFLWHGGYYPDECGQPFALLRGKLRAQIPFLDQMKMTMLHYSLGVSQDCMAIHKKILVKNLPELRGYFASLDISLKSAPSLQSVVSPWGQWEYAHAPGTPTNKEIIDFSAKWGKMLEVLPLRNANMWKSLDHGWMLNLHA